ncbi:MAG: glycerol-3-phosphate dehydrogenase/oxidase [Capsulimonadaceae bacterium]|nr:glycerol-3-phosphate dehydrogenase/oxidase [Capsulimonadaceae bacterium]
MKTLSQSDRQQSLELMGSTPVDVLVIGGGITGVSVAFDAALQGYSVALVEKSDYASGTSSKSTKLAHGGIRYLPQLDFGLVHEALIERGRLFRNAPWLVRPISFVLPLYDWSKRPLGLPIAPPWGIGLPAIVNIGLSLYDLLAGKLNVRKHSRLSFEDLKSAAPALATRGIRAAFAYHDGQTDDVRLTLAILRSAANAGALTANYAEVTGFDIDSGAIRSVRVRDSILGRDYTVRARHVVNATGVHAARIEELTGRASQITISPSKGVHLIVDARTLPVGDHAIVLPETDDGRLMFIIPWRERVLIGTTDTVGDDIDEPVTTQDDVAYLIDHCNRYLNFRLRPEDVISTMAGYRPLTKRADNGSTRSLSRRHLLHDGPCGMISITGGKLTTCRIMAEETVAHINRREGRRGGARTVSALLDGGENWPIDWAGTVAAVAVGALPTELTRHLEETYGGNAVKIVEMIAERPEWAAKIVDDLPYVVAEVAYACRYEQALVLEDVLERRIRIALERCDHGIAVASKVAALMAAELGWSDARVKAEIGSFEAGCARRYAAVATDAAGAIATQETL